MSDVRQVVADATRRLQAAGIPAATAEARWLVSDLLGTSPAGLVFVGDLTPAERQRVEEAVARRETREPLQHILGTAPFGDLDLAVGPGVFVPRPETESMAQFAIGWLRHRTTAADRAARVVDACAGSGALALAVASHVRAEVTAIEVGQTALPWLRRNVSDSAPRLAASGSVVRVVAGDVTTAAPWPPSGSQDLVVANPPYIPEGCVPRDPEVRDHDPALALYGGADGFAVGRPLIARAADVLRSGGLVLIEHADDQGGPDGIPGLLADSGAFTEVADHQDLAGRPRFTAALRV